MRLLLAIVVVVALLPEIALAQSLKIERDTEIAFTLTNARPTITSRAPAAPNAYEQNVFASFRRGEHADAIGQNGDPVLHDAAQPDPPKAPAETIRARFTQMPGHTLLLVENGYDRGLIFHATMYVNGDPQPTDVCLVMPGKVGVEHWPYAIDAIEMRDLKLVPWRYGDAIPCE